jgi:Mrp family chromosome partitioning ATPase/capsular polysaccharide biosynthesis protein
MNEVLDPGTAVPQRADPQPETLDLRAYIRPIWRWKWVVIAMAILAAGATYALTSREQKVYQSSIQLYVTNPNPAAALKGESGNAISAADLQDMATLFTARPITVSVYNKLHRPFGSAGSVVVSASQTSDFLTITAASHSGVLAAQLATAYVSVFLAAQTQSVVSAAQADASASTSALKAIPPISAANQAERAALVAQIAAYDADARNPSPGATVTQPAYVSTVPVSPKPTRDAIFAAVIGLLLGIGLAFFLDLADRRLLRVSTVESLYGRTVVAVLPHVSSPSPKVNGAASTPPEFVEVMRSLRVNMRLAAGGQPLKSVIVTSALPSEGKSTCVRDLAFAYADAGERVLVIDCDLRRPSLAGVFFIKPEAGLVQVLRREVTPADAAVTVFRNTAASSNGSGPRALAAGDPRANGSITVITHGERVESPAALLSSTAMSELLKTASAIYDIVILDTSPILTVSDAVPLLDQVAAVLFVARLGMTTREAAERLTDLGRRVPNMNLVGVVVNDMRDSYVDEGYSYYSQYGYSYAHPDEAAVAVGADAYAPTPGVDALPDEHAFAHESGSSNGKHASSSEPASKSKYDPASPYDPAV